ncbi:lysozyme inhibitor LprI family protein [Stenotrophomonas sp. YIM B06876]|uniref:lysozyme inhibitor LprI family protein n=1 Tax=Stenotrophomonas sp. YIM B06876 TaxID=3060211 RepID=UPI002738CBA5|nr:lysozyme inhibitor LprI family protein [Stenotrophomonas sp. YIM B06876]
MKQTGIWTMRGGLLLACALGLAAPASYAAKRANPKAALTADCMTLHDVAAKEACMATSGDFKDCPNTDLRCAPYRRMHALDTQLLQASAQLVQDSRKAYASLTANDPAYLDDLDAGMRRADLAWRASRDADCAVEPMVQGMSRVEVTDLIEACRVDRTQERLGQLDEWRAALIIEK